MVSLVLLWFQNFRCRSVSVSFKRKTAVSVFLNLDKSTKLPVFIIREVARRSPPPNEKYSEPWNILIRSNQI